MLDLLLLHHITNCHNINHLHMNVQRSTVCGGGKILVLDESIFPAFQQQSRYKI